VLSSPPWSSSPSATVALHGESSAELFARQAARESNARTYPRGLPLAIGHARGCEVWSVEGRRYLDFFSGAGVLAVGHNHPKVVEAVRRQLDVLVHALDLPTPARDRFVTDVLSLLPENMRVHVCAPTGSDASKPRSSCASAPPAAAACSHFKVLITA
jgi:diaminobutyrate-2-oxoglutarate transaminase